MLRKVVAARLGSVLLLCIVLSIANNAFANAVVLDSPSSGSTLSGTVAVTITTSSSVWWASVHIDGHAWVTTPGNTWYWNTTGVADGSHTITATAYDQNQNVLGTSSAAVTVSNTRAVTLTAPANAASVSGASVPVRITMNSSVWWASVHIDGKAWVVTPPGTTWSWNSTAVANGPHTITATAYGANETVLGTNSVNVTVNNSQPVKLTAPANGATVSGSSVPVSISITSSVWWASVHIDGQPWVTTPATQWDWNTTGLADGSHTITAIAYDQNENVLGTSSATVEVSNTGATPTASTPTPQPSSAPTPAAGGHGYYVSSSGSDSNAGTSTSSPWRTVARVNAANLQPGDVVYFKSGGIWREKLAPASGGSSGAPITFSWYGSGAQPIISGSDVVSGWSSAGGSTYSAPLTKAPNNVFVDGSPGWGLTHACCSAGQSCGASGSCAIGPMRAGSWYYSSSAAKLYVWLSNSSSPSGHTVEAATRTAGIDVSANGNEKSDIVIDGLEVQRTGGYGIHFYSGDSGGQGLSGIVVRNCTVTQTGTGQVDDNSYYNGIHYSQAQELNTAPLYQNNTISWTGNHGNGINSQNADGARLIGNHVTHFNHHGLDMKQSANVVVRDNVVHDSNGNGIYQQNSANGLIEGNTVYNLSGPVAGKGSGIQIDVGSSSPRIYNNSIYNVLSGIYLTVAGTARNNIVTNASLNPLEASGGGTFDYNDWGPNALLQENGSNYSFSQWQALGGHSHDMAQNPLWVNPAGANFSLQQGSPCLNAGTNVGLPYNGSAPDLGAVESSY